MMVAVCHKRDTFDSFFDTCKGQNPVWFSVHLHLAFLMACEGETGIRGRRLGRVGDQAVLAAGGVWRWLMDSSAWYNDTRSGS